MSRRFDEAAVAGVRAALGDDIAREKRAAVAPHRDIAAVAGGHGVGEDPGVGIDVCVYCRGRGPFAVKVPADLDIAAAGIAGSVDKGAAHDADIITQHRDIPAVAAAAVARGIEQPVIHDGAGRLPGLVGGVIACNRIRARCEERDAAAIAAVRPALRRGLPLEEDIGSRNSDLSAASVVRGIGEDERVVVYLRVVRLPPAGGADIIAANPDRAAKRSARGKVGAQQHHLVARENLDTAAGRSAVADIGTAGGHYGVIAAFDGNRAARATGAGRSQQRIRVVGVEVAGVDGDRAARSAAPIGVDHAVLRDGGGVHEHRAAGFAADIDGTVLLDRGRGEANASPYAKASGDVAAA